MVIELEAILGPVTVVKSCVSALTTARARGATIVAKNILAQPNDRHRSGLFFFVTHSAGNGDLSWVSSTVVAHSNVCVKGIGPQAVVQVVAT